MQMSKVAIIKCSSYDEDKVYQSVLKGIDLLGGISQFVGKDEKILLKPNMLVGADPSKATTTHPSIFNAISKILIDGGYNVKYGDSPGLGSPQKVAEKTGLMTIAQKYGIELADFNTSVSVSSKTAHRSKQFDIAKGVLEADAIINLPKMKSHMLQKITGAVKNPMGCIQGFKKGMMHAKFTNPYSFAEMLVDLDNLLPLKLHIMDGIVAMEGNGPRSGDPVSMNVILISDDPVAIDTVFCKLIDLDPALIPTNTYGEEYGLGTCTDIELVGDDIAPLINKDFNIERTQLKKEDSSKMYFFRKFVVRKPILVKENCISCGICEEACPVNPKAVVLSGDKNLPKFDYKKCVRCFCCQEMCPKRAITAKTPLLGKMLVYRK